MKRKWSARTVVFLGERDDALDLRGALEHRDCLLGGVGDDERPGGGGGAFWGADNSERLERAGRGRNLEERRGGGKEEALSGHGGRRERKNFWGLVVDGRIRSGQGQG